MLLALRQIDKDFGGHAVLRGISLAFAPGTITLIVGPNGSGKSTLLRIMAGLCPPDAGHVEQSCGTVGYLGHATFLYPDLNALENLAFWQRAAGREPSEAELAAALDRVALARFAEEKTATFSRGMAQRLNLARVFSLEPDLLLLDEPGTGLDRRSRAILLRETAATRARGGGVVWVSHEADDLRSADRVIALDRKRVVFDGSVEAYLRRPEKDAC